MVVLLLTLLVKVVISLKPGTQQVGESCFKHGWAHQARCSPELECIRLPKSVSGLCYGKLGHSCQNNTNCVQGLFCVANKCASNTISKSTEKASQQKLVFVANNTVNAANGTFAPAPNLNNSNAPVANFSNTSNAIADMPESGLNSTTINSTSINLE